MGLDSRRFETICVYLTKNSDKPNFFKEKGCKVFYVSKKNRFRMFNPWVIWKLSRVLKREKVDILHCHRHKPTVYGVIAATLAGTPTVISHVHGMSRTKNLKRKLTNFFVFKKVNKIVTIGEAVREDVLKTNPSVQPDKVVSIGISIDYQRYVNVPLTKSQAKERLNLPQDSFVFGTVGRLAPTKGQTYLIRAFEKVKEALPSVQLILIGDGRLRNQLKYQAVETSYTDCVHFLGHRDDVPELLRAMDVFVFPSLAEGMGKALLEAMAAGVPCVGTKVGGIPEIIINNETGFLVPPKDENANVRVQSEYNHKVIIRRLERLYETAMI